MRTDARPVPRRSLAALIAVGLCLLAASPAAADPPVPGTVTIEGRAMVGSKLIYTDTTPFGDFSKTFSWKRCEDALGNACGEIATTPGYRLTPDENGKYIRLDVTYTDWDPPNGTSSASSAYLGPVATHDPLIEVPGDFSTIQDAIDDASDGDTIQVAAGTYPESPFVAGYITDQATTLTITGAGSGTTHVTGGSGFSVYDAADVSVSGFDVAGSIIADDASVAWTDITAAQAVAIAHSAPARTVSFDDVHVSGFSGTGVSMNGAELTATFEDGSVTAGPGGTVGVSASSGSNVLLEDSTVDMSAGTANGRQAVVMNPASRPADATIRGNTITGTVYGIVAGTTGSLTIDANTIAVTTGEGINNYSDATITDNVVSGGSYGLFASDSATITGNSFRGASLYGLRVHASLGVYDIRGNAFVGNAEGGIHNSTNAAVTAEHNWFGCNEGPGAPGCDDVDNVGMSTTDYDPWIEMDLTASASPIGRSGTSTLTIDMQHDSDEAYTADALLLPDIAATLETTHGTLSDETPTVTDGLATAVLTGPGSAGIATVTAQVDEEDEDVEVAIGDPPDLTALSITGTPQYRATLTANDTTTGDGLAKHYQWQRCDELGANCADVGLDQATYDLGHADIGSVVKVTLTVSSPYGPDDSATAATAGPVVPIPVDVTVAKDSTTPGPIEVPVTGADVDYSITVTASGNTVDGVDVHDHFSPNLDDVEWTCATTGGSACENASGTGDIGETVTVAPGHPVVFDATATIHYGSDISLANQAFVEIPTGFEDDFGDDDSATVDHELEQVVPVVTIDDETPTFDQVLTAGDDVTGPGLTREYQWERCDEPLTTCTDVGTDNDQYTPVGADVGSIIKVTETITGDHGTATIDDVTDAPVAPAAVDLGITKADTPSGTLHVAPGGSALSYTITVTHHDGPTVVGATVTDDLPAALTGATWTCATTGGSSCANASGGGDISETVTVASGHPVVFAVDGTVAHGGTGTISNTATVVAPLGYDDTVPGNDSDTETTPRDNVPALAWDGSPNLAYTERAAPTSIDPGTSLTVADPDEDITGATVVVGAGHGSGDTLAATTAGTSISANYNAGTWTLTLSGADTAAHYQQVLRSVTFENQLHDPSSAQRTIEIAVTDAATNSSSDSRPLDFTAVNDAPLVVPTGSIRHGAGVVDAGISISDADSASLSSATAEITAGHHAGDVLSAPGLPGGLTAGYAGDTLTISGSASVATYESALRSVTLAAGDATDKDVTFVVTDDEGAESLDSAPRTRHVDLDDVTLVVDDPLADDSGGCGFAADPCGTIQHGIDNAAPGDTVKVAPGTYGGEIYVYRSVTLEADGGTPTVALSGSDRGFNLYADDVVIDGFKFTGTAGTRPIDSNDSAGHSGIVLRNLDISGVIEAVNVRTTGSGAPWVIEDSTFTSNNVAVFAPLSVDDVVIQDNTFTDNGSAVSFTNGSQDVTVRRNATDTGMAFAGATDLAVADNTFDEGTLHLTGANDGVDVTGNSFTGASRMIAISGPANTGVGITGNTLLRTGGVDPIVSVAANAHGGTLHIHRNRIFGADTGIANATGNTIDATNNWWGCNDGPTGAGGCPGLTGAGAGSVDADPWLTLTATTPTATIKPGASTALQATVGKNSDGQAVANPFPPATISFSAGSGSFTPASGLPDATDGHLDTTWTAAAANATLTASLDNATANVPVTVSAAAGDGGSANLPAGGHFETGNSVNGTDRQDASIDLPPGTSGIVVLQEEAGDGGYSIPAGYGWQTTGFNIEAPDPGAGNQLTLTFLAYLPGVPLSEVEIFRNGTRLTAACPADPCVEPVVDMGGGVFQITVHTRFASFWVVGGPDPEVVMLSGPGVSPTSQYTNDNTPTFTYKTQINGIDVPDVNVTYACAIGLVENDCDPGTFTADTPIADGARTFEVQAQVAAIAGPITEADFFVDTAPPVPTIDSGPAQPYTASQSASFTFSPHDPGPSSGIAGVTCTLDGNLTPCTFPKTGLAEGPHSFFVTYTDNAGNSASSATYDWRIDITAPVSTINPTKPGLDQGIQAQGPPTFATRSDDATFSFSSSDPFSPPANASGMAQIQCRLDGGPWGAANCGPYTGLAHGVHTWQVRGIDNVGNTEVPGAGQTWTWFVDLVAPDILPTYPYENGRFSYYKDVNAEYACDDHIGPPFPSQSGVLTPGGCEGDVPVGTPFDHTSQGMPASDNVFDTYTFTIDTEDNVGNTASRTFDYRVFTFAGLILDDDPKAYYRMDDPEGSDELLDFSGNDNDGEYKNGTESGPIGISGDDNTARIFTGADGYGYVNDMPAPHRKYTMAAFVQFDNDEDGMVMQHGRAGALFRRGDSFVFRQTEEEVELAVPGGIIPGCWYFVGGRFDGFHATVYAGTHDGSTDCTPTTSTGLEWFSPQTITSSSQPSGEGSTFYVGYGEHAQWLHGMLDEVAYFDTDIGAVHVKELWLADPQPPVRRVGSSYSESSSQPAVPAPTADVSGAVAPVKTAAKPNPKAAAKARAAKLAKRIAKAKAYLKALKRRGAPKRRIAAAKRNVARLQKQLRAAKRRA